MKVLVAGASGVVGRPLLPLLESAGHEVVGLARTVRPGPTRMLAVDALDRDAVSAAVREVAPDAVVNLLTAIPARLNPRRMATEFALTDRLRTEGTRNLVEAARAAGVRRLIAEGLAYAYDPTGAGPADEDEPLWRRPPAGFASALAALTELEATTTAAGGTVLRMGHLYGPGTMFAADGSFVADIRAGKVPIVGNGGSVFSFVHVDDVASAVVAALGRDVPGVLNVVDDEPVRLGEWLPAVAEMLGAPRPRRMPKALVRLVAGGWGAAFLGELRGADNARARRELDWQPRHPSWRAGLADELAAAVVRG